MDELILEVQRRVKTRAQEFVEEKVLKKYYMYDFLFNHGKLLPTCEAALLLPDKICSVEGSSTLTREHFRDLNKLAHSFIKKQDAQRKQLAEQAAFAT